MDLFEQFVTPIAPYFICTHFISTEVHDTNKYIGINLDLKANDLIKHKNYNDIKNFDIIQIQVDLFDFFHDEILPIIIKNNVKVIIITSQWHLPQIEQSTKTDNVLNKSNIILWISQNLIYKHEKYMAFPYGICHLSIYDYVNFMNSHNTDKTVKLLNQRANVHQHLPENHIRRKFEIFGNNSGAQLNYTDFLTKISQSDFVISTAGDRDDCYRHYECIGLHAIPVSNIGVGYKDIFGDDMIYSTAEEMIQMIDENAVKYTYTKPNRDILKISYWVSKIKQKIDSLVNFNHI
jgi:hypothetical protein